MEIENFTISPSSSLREVLERIGKNAKGIALLVDEQGRLITTVTDGDLRRAILADIHLDEHATVLVALFLRLLNLQERTWGLMR